MPADDRHAYAKDTEARIRNQNQAVDVIGDYLVDAYEAQVLEPLKKRLAEWADRVLDKHTRR